MFSTRRRLRVRLFFEGALVGIVTGVIVAALRLLVDAADAYRPKVFAQIETFGGVCVAAGVMILVATFLAWATRLDGQVAGSGIPQLKGILQGRTKMFKPLRLLAIKFCATVFGIGAGLSLGRAGISVQFGAAVGNLLTKMIYVGKGHHEAVEGNVLLTAGAGAGLAAIFNAPLAGVIFCIEELRQRFSPEILIATVSAAVSASFVTKIIFGVRPVFETITATPLNLPPVITLPTPEMVATLSTAPLKFAALFVTLGVICGATGAIFSKALIRALEAYDALRLFGVRRYALPLLTAIPLGKELPQVLGCGNVLVDELLTTRPVLSVLMIFLLSKALYTLLSFGTNAPGGLFLPVLIIGALVGNIFARVGNELSWFTSDWTTLFIIFGMVGFFAAVVKAPVTGSVLLLELTGQFEHLTGLIVVSGAAFLVADLCGGEPIFSALLARKKPSSIDKD